MAKKTSLLASSKAVDPRLEALFASSSGPVSAPHKSRYQKLRSNKPKPASDDDDDEEVLSEASEELDYDDDDDDDNDDQDRDEKENGEAGTSDEDDSEEATSEESNTSEETEMVAEPRKERKRKRKDENEDLEDKYLANLTKEDAEEPSGKRAKAETDNKDSSSDADDADADDKEDLPTHESLSKEATAAETDKAARTVFLSNVAASAISSKAARKSLLLHLASALDPDAHPPQKVESLRFRSVAFSTAAMPKRAAYITKAVMEATARSAHAYAVLSTAAAARRACQRLNGSEVLGRHVRVDSVAHPSPTDHRRCVFVGNLGFVDDETVLVGAGKHGEEKEARKRNKVPADVEEGLWRTFAKNGKVENVRVVRDPKTRVGKGFAYVQFYDANAVEEAILLDGKSFPPMLPRKLRVTRAKDPRKTAQAMERAKSKFNSNKSTTANDAHGRPSKKRGALTYVPKMTPDQQAAAGRAGKLFGRARAAAANSSNLPGSVRETPEKIVFEGRRASSRDALPKDLKLGKKGKAKRGRPTTRSARRGNDWKKKKSDN